VGINEKEGPNNIYINIIQDMYEGPRTYVKSLCGAKEYFKVGVGVHQGIVLSSYLFSMAMNVVMKDMQDKVPWCMMFADKIVLVGKNLEKVNNRLGEWRLVCLDG
jgi:hypothetical protein